MENQPTENAAQPQDLPYAPNFAQPPARPQSPLAPQQPPAAPPISPAAPENIAQPLTQPLPVGDQPNPPDTDTSKQQSSDKSTSDDHAAKSQDEAAKEEAKKEKSKAKLQEAIDGSTDVLASATTKMTMFPDTLTVDRTKVTVTRRNFFRMAEVMSMRVEDILNVTTTVGPFYGTVKIISRVLNAKPYTVGLFKREDATHIKRILQGYVIALQSDDIDCGSLSKKELLNLLGKLGEDNHPTVPSEEKV